MPKPTTTIRSTSRRKGPVEAIPQLDGPDKTGAAIDPHNNHAETAAPLMGTRKNEASPEVKESTAAWASCMRELLRRHGVSSRKYARVVAEILGMEYITGYRRISGKQPWRSDEIEKIARHFGETATQVLEPLLAQPAEPAVLMVGTLKVKCVVILGVQLSPPFADQLVAIGGLDTWLIVSGSDVGLPAREVRQLIFTSPVPVASSMPPQDAPDDLKTRR